MSEVHVSVGPVDASGTKIVFTTPVSIHFVRARAWQSRHRPPAKVSNLRTGECQWEYSGSYRQQS